MSILVVKKAGALTLIEDSGRYGHMNMGITQSGVMDRYSYNFLNKLLENKSDTNCLEMVFGDIELKSNVNSFIAVTGALCELFINGEKKQNWVVHKIVQNDTITIGKILKGQRVYLGIKGGFDIQSELGSVATTLKEELGGINGAKLKNGEILACNEYIECTPKRVSEKLIPTFEDTIELRVVLGYQEDSFLDSEKEKFFSSTYEVMSQSNRMAYKLNGETISSTLNGIVSEAISLGSIQIPKDGQPIVLLNERQTIGGYPKIGVVIPRDCSKLAQAKAGNKISFKKISLEEAIKEEKLFLEFFS